MPTGYTAAVLEGITFNEFAMRCVRAMGVAVTMRDEPSSTPIPERFEPSPFYAEKTAKARAELERLQGLSPEQAEQEADKDFSRLTEARNKFIRECDESRVKYTAMLESVRAWAPPTPDHEGFKEFMLKQLDTSIDHDCDTSFYDEPARQTGSEWLASQIAMQRGLVERCGRMAQEEVERVTGRNEWLRQLRESLVATPR